MASPSTVLDSHLPSMHWFTGWALLQVDTNDHCHSHVFFFFFGITLLTVNMYVF